MSFPFFLRKRLFLTWCTYISSAPNVIDGQTTSKINSTSLMTGLSTRFNLCNKVFFFLLFSFLSALSFPPTKVYNHLACLTQCNLQLALHLIFFHWQQKFTITYKCLLETMQLTFSTTFNIFLLQKLARNSKHDY